MRIGLIIVAAGSGTRMGGAVRKPLLPLAGEPVVLHSLRAFSSISEVTRRVVVLAADDFQSGSLADHELEQLLTTAGADSLLPGGAERHLSVQAGLADLPDCELILIHDGVRPFASPELIRRVIAATAQHGAAVPGIAVTDTIKEVGPGGLVIRTPERSRLRAIQTPQGFRRQILLAGFSAAEAAGGPIPTDEAMLCEAAGFPVAVVDGDARNIKLTTPADMQTAEQLVREQATPLGKGKA